MLLLYIECYFNLQPKRSDLDMNHHVNNVKYVRWMLEVKENNFLLHQNIALTYYFR
jgi:fatty acyl-ACP thioesterase B